MTMSPKDTTVVTYFIVPKEFLHEEHPPSTKKHHLQQFNKSTNVLVHE